MATFLLHSEIFHDTNVVTCTHNIGRKGLGIRLVIDGAVRPDLVSSISFDPADPLNVMRVDLTQVLSGRIQVFSQNVISSQSFPSPTGVMWKTSSASQNVNSNTNVPLSFGSNEHVGLDFTPNSATRVTIDSAGIYEVSYTISWESTSSSRRNVKVWAEVDGVTAKMSTSYAYSRNSTDSQGTNSSTFLVKVISSSYIEFFSVRAGTSGTANSIIGECGFHIKRVG